MTFPDRIVVEAGAPLRGTLRMPGDKSISHRALLLAARADGVSTVRGLSDGDDVARTAAAVRALGASVDGDTVSGGLSRLREPTSVVDVGNSGTSIRLLAGYVAGFPWLTVLQGDGSIARRPMGRVAEPLRAMGASVDGREGGTLPPLVVRGGDLKGIEYTPPVASAQVKSAILLAGLSAAGETIVHEPHLTRAHTEELLELAGADISVEEEGRTIRLRGGPLQPFVLDVPGDPSQAAFWVVAATIVPGSELTIENVYVGPARAGFLDVLARMGADVEVRRRSGDATSGPVADLHVRAAPLSATDVSGEEIPGLDEIPVLAVAAAVAEGTTTFSGVGELRVKESDRIETTASELRALGAAVETAPESLVVRGGGGLRGGRVRSHGDHRIAMSMAVAGLAADGVTTIDGWSAVATSYPRFEQDLSSCR